MATTAFTVGELSKLTGVTVRALHHYDELGLVRPSARTPAGYRLYADHDVRRLQQVLLFRALELPLDAIAGVLDDPTARDRALRAHRDVLVDKRARLDDLLATLDATLNVVTSSPTPGVTMQPEDVQKLFAGFDHAAHADEAEATWGETAAFRESARRTKRYGEAEWAEIRREAAAIYARLAELMAAGTPVTDSATQLAVADHRAHLERWFYPCSRELHRGLGEMYVADHRFTANLDRISVGLAAYLRDAIAAT